MSFGQWQVIDGGFASLMDDLQMSMLHGLGEEGNGVDTVTIPTTTWLWPH